MAIPKSCRFRKTRGSRRSILTENPRPSSKRFCGNWITTGAYAASPLRYFNACGAEPGAGLGEAHNPETHLIPLLFRAIATGEPIQIFGDDYATPDGTCIRDYIHVSDLATAHLAALDHLLAGGASGAFNVGTGKGQTVMEVLRAVEEVTGQARAA